MAGLYEIHHFQCEIHHFSARLALKLLWFLRSIADVGSLPGALVSTTGDNQHHKDGTSLPVAIFKSKMMDFALKRDEFCINDDEFCIKNDELNANI